LTYIKDNIKLEEMLNEIKIYDVIIKPIQGTYIPKLLKFGVLHEAFVFMRTSFAGESFVSIGDITEVEKQLAVNGLLAIHALGVLHGDIRLENIMVDRNLLERRSRVWWVDFAWSKITDNNTEVLELTELESLLKQC
jgi:serine/threonine protein kinase